MSSQAPIKRVTAPDIRARKGATPIVALTSYDARTSALADPHCDLILVGDSVGMVKHGLDSTVPVTLDMMILHGKAVMRAAKHALVVVDLPFGSYESSRERAFESAVRVVQETGCGAVKVEGGAHTAETIAFLVARGIPVLAHVGLTPQAINVLGTFRARGRNVEEEELIAGDARAVAEAGAFAVVLEAMAEPLAARITREVAVPSIGIGASAACDGQILVVDDMLGFTPRVPKFVKRYAELGAAAEAAIAAYAAEVRDRSFPAAAHVYEIKKAKG